MDTAYPRVAIEFCRGCRWGLRAGWMAQELLVTFDDALGEVAVAPSRVGGTFAVRYTHDADSAPVVLWDRKADGGFPELKVLKQRVRDRLDPERSLGHSDRAGAAAAIETEKTDQ